MILAFVQEKVPMAEIRLRKKNYFFYTDLQYGEE